MCIFRKNTFSLALWISALFVGCPEWNAVDVAQKDSIKKRWDEVSGPPILLQPPESYFSLRIHAGEVRTYVAILDKSIVAKRTIWKRTISDTDIAVDSIQRHLGSYLQNGLSEGYFNVPVAKEETRRLIINDWITDPQFKCGILRKRLAEYDHQWKRIDNWIDTSLSVLGAGLLSLLQRKGAATAYEVLDNSVLRPQGISSDHALLASGKSGRWNWLHTDSVLLHDHPIRLASNDESPVFLKVPGKPRQKLDRTSPDAFVFVDVEPETGHWSSLSSEYLVTMGAWPPTARLDDMPYVNAGFYDKEHDKWYAMTWGVDAQHEATHFFSALGTRPVLVVSPTGVPPVRNSVLQFEGPVELQHEAQLERMKSGPLLFVKDVKPGKIYVFSRVSSVSIRTAASVKADQIQSTANLIARGSELRRRDLQRLNEWSIALKSTVKAFFSLPTHDGKSKSFEDFAASKLGTSAPSNEDPVQYIASPLIRLLGQAYETLWAAGRGDVEDVLLHATDRFVEGASEYARGAETQEQTVRRKIQAAVPTSK